MSTLPTTSLGMLDGMKAKSLEQWYRFFVQYYPGLCELCRRKMRDAELAEDVVQDVMATVAQKIESFDHNGHRGAFRHWLLQILRSRREDLRRKWHIDVSNQDVDELVAPTHLEDDQTVSLRLQLALAVLAKTREPRTVEAFWLYAHDGQSPEYVAQRLGMTSAAAVRTAAARCKQQLRQLLDDFYPESWSLESLDRPDPGPTLSD